MFFVLSKILGFVALPSNFIACLGLLGVLAIILGWRRIAVPLFVVAALLFALGGLTPLGRWLILPLEQRFAASAEAAGPPVDGIVVLGGAIDTGVSIARHQPALNEAAERLTVVAALARRYPQARIVFSGGSGALLFDGGSEAPIADALWRSFGIDPARIELERRSRNTAENAEFTRELVKPGRSERWLLVTSAYHMPRSIGCFRHAGFPVEAFPVDYRTAGPQDVWRFDDRASDALRRVDAATREWIGLLVYRLSGRIDTLFPAPDPQGFVRAARAS
jgi:uncharacterized SAM-binding protein YcdF (DUF218 family)